MKLNTFFAAVLVISLSTGVATAQNSGTANSTPQYNQPREKSNAQIAAEYAAKAAAKASAAREAAARLARAGFENSSKVVKKVGAGKVGGVVGGVLGNPKTACAPSKPEDC